MTWKLRYAKNWTCERYWEISLKVKCFAKVTLPKNNDQGKFVSLWLILKVACPGPRIPVTSSIRDPNLKILNLHFRNWNLGGDSNPTLVILKEFLPCKKLYIGWNLKSDALENDVPDLQGWVNPFRFHMLILRGVNFLRLLHHQFNHHLSPAQTC